MTFDNLDVDDIDMGPEGSPEGDTSNRTFLLVAGILGAVTLLAIICIVVYAFAILPRQRAQREAQVATLNAQNTQVAQSVRETELAQAFTATWTATVTPLPSTATPTRTQVVQVPTNTPVPTEDPSTATVSAFLTQAAQVATATPTPTQSLPGTGFMDDVGLPGLLGAALLLLVVIVFARRLRTA